MTLRHVLTIFVALAGIGVLGAVITSACRRLWDWREQRAYVPPALFTEVHVSKRGWVPVDPAWPTPSPEETLELFESVCARVPDWVMRAAPVDEQLSEFARPVPTAPALIGSEVEALFELRRLAVTA